VEAVKVVEAWAATQITAGPGAQAP
jgi:hypothetical protein